MVLLNVHNLVNGPSRVVLVLLINYLLQVETSVRVLDCLFHCWVGQGLEPHTVQNFFKVLLPTSCRVVVQGFQFEAQNEEIGVESDLAEARVSGTEETTLHLIFDVLFEPGGGIRMLLLSCLGAVDINILNYSWRRRRCKWDSLLSSFRLFVSMLLAEILDLFPWQGLIEIC